jgi:hypothetical protein
VISVYPIVILEPYTYNNHKVTIHSSTIIVTSVTYSRHVPTK